MTAIKLTEIKPLMQKLLLTLLLSMLVFFSFSQGTFITAGSDGTGYLERLDIKYGKIIPIEHTADKPFHRGTAAKIAETLLLSNLRFNKVQQYQLQWLVDDNAEWLDSLQSRTRKPFIKVLYREPASFAHVSSKKKGLFDLRFNPIIAANVGYESEDGRFIFTRSLGLEVRGNIMRVFSFYFNATGNSARNPFYVSQKATTGTYKYVPGQSYWKDYSSKPFKFTDGVDYFDARGYINVNVLKYINLSFGRDKFFIGNGQRSMMLSDFAAPYLFLRFNVNIWRFNYTSIFAELNSQYIRGLDQLLPKKYMAVHHLSIQATRWMNIGLFEAVVMNRSNHFELQYLNPIIFYRAVEHALGSPDNELLGIDWKFNAINHLSIYGQFVLDEFNFKNAIAKNGWWANKWAMQWGVKYIDIAPGFDAQLEVNIARPFMYTHGGDINYSHYNQPLAHPLGANFYEIILNLHYQPIPRLSLNAKYFVAKVGDDTIINANSTFCDSCSITNFGGNILVNSNYVSQNQPYGHKKIGDGAGGFINYFQLLVSYQAWHNIYIDAEVLYRSKSTLKSINNPQTSTSSFMFNVGLRMNLAYRKNEF